ncbi:LOW QUALITY PROTEIN: hypothetical protein PHMEG_00012086 [Phytophthora megakarya]|uniref:HTH CENPB-type domain-containing protein n=1 Tax=Phytophthora megakarya TaxID=4795 RepID=A0A225WAM0_9STRA|nr:LOW QUALITY PROTEIN: hypothetical protein PHMEG_00012086 [Phytophthora megakarya]
MRCVPIGRYATEVTGVFVLHTACLCQNVHARDKAYTCPNTTWTCWEKYHRYYLPKKLFSRTGKVRTSSDLYKLKRSLLVTENEEDPSTVSEVGVADARSVIRTIALYQNRRRPKGRRRLPGGNGRKVKTNTVSSYFTSHKLEITLRSTNDIELTISSFYPELPESKYNSRRTLILSWRRTRDKIEILRSDRGGRSKKKELQRGEATILSNEDEADLVRWINDLREEGVPVTSTMLRLQALEVARSAEILSASWSWQHRLRLVIAFPYDVKLGKDKYVLPIYNKLLKNLQLTLRQKRQKLEQPAFIMRIKQYLPKQTLAKKVSKRNRQNISEPILLLLDDFSRHWTEDVIEYAKTINVTLMKVPSNATSVLQPADATWNGPLKKHRQLCRDSENVALSNATVDMKPSMKQALNEKILLTIS